MSRMRIAARRRAPYGVHRLGNNSGHLLLEDGSIWITADDSTRAIAAFPLVDAPDDADVMMIVRGGANYQLSSEDFFAYLAG
jgi:hypothetical protein